MNFESFKNRQQFNIRVTRFFYQIPSYADRVISGCNLIVLDIRLYEITNYDTNFVIERKKMFE